MIGNIFKAYDVRATYPEPLNEEAAWCVGYGTGEYLKKNNGGETGLVLVSRDMRPHSPGLCKAMSEGIRATGMDVVDLGMCDTSFMYFAVPYLKAVGGVQTTASHNPINYNGFKISKDGARPVGADTGLKEIEAIAKAFEGEKPEPTGSFEVKDLWAEYRKHIQKFLVPLTKPMKVFVDGSNGMAGKLVPEAFFDVENLEISDVYFEMGNGFVHEPNPLVAENMIPTQEGVKKIGAVAGACFDGDADRCMVVDETGEVVGCDHMTAMLAEYYFAKDNPGTTIVYDLRSSKVVEETIARLGMKAKKSKVGHVNMKAALRETEGAFGGELSGHFYFRDNNYADSGAITFACVLSVLEQTGKKLSELVEPYRKYPQSGEINFEVEDKVGVMNLLKDKYASVATVEELDGVSIDAFDGEGWWFNVRASNTEPLLRLNAEAKDKVTLDKLLKELEPHLGTPAEGH
ncbi:Phosphomannomutase/phosphoglucomutase [Poriferisphaera corsica]|uniref:Phosphomannomutase/phosphoglucomutase n=1 Tax=Poriferisphaera corsica TaxID=2528020 RepID=A0A517YWQ9_9BACT|nr:phosphomannomutase/phosphoglucomutase [Poriferisphaera corsica]QDU34642.1 Phosphomannomutase/phosphoglucomutase [Poriferisphaera corsica]